MPPFSVLMELLWKSVVLLPLAIGWTCLYIGFCMAPFVLIAYAFLLSPYWCGLIAWAVLCYWQRQPIQRFLQGK